MEWLIPAVTATLTSSVVLILVYAYLYRQERDDFMGTWTLSWGLYACRFVFVLLSLTVARHPVFLVAAQLCALWFAYFLLKGADQFSGRDTSRGWLVVSLVDSVWIVAAVWAGLPFLWLTLPTFGFLALVSFWTGRIFLRLETAYGLGTRLIGYAFIVWGAHKLNYPFLRPVQWIAPWGYILGAVLALIAAIGIILVYFEKTRSDLARSEERLKLALESANDAIWDWFFETGDVYFSPRWYTMLGYEPFELPPSYETWKGLLHPDDASHAEKVVTDHLESIEPFEIEVRMRTKDGGWRWVLSRGKVVERDEHGRGRRILGTHVDIHERKLAEEERVKLEAQLLQAQKMEALGTLSGGIAHDFNNILGAIVGYANLARADAEAGTVDPDDIDEIILASERAKRLVQQIMTFSRRVDPERKPISVNEQVRRAVALLRPTLPKMISTELRLSSDLERVNADPNQLHQVILNLSTNAAQAMPDGGQLTLATESVRFHGTPCRCCGTTLSGDFVALTVSDTGHGIQPEHLPRVFEPFFTTKEVGKGTGLGLATVHGIVSSHAGHLDCQSEVGRGTTFHVYLPLDRGAKEAEAKESASGVADPTGGCESILLVDDEEKLLRAGARLLQRAGYEVRTASSGEEALELYRERGDEIDLLVLDLGMPGMGGYKALEEILRIDPQAKVVIASGYSATGKAERALEGGAVGYMGKPFNRVELLTTVRNALDEPSRR